ncbi:MULTISPECIES: Wzz/FepE/Etk N-terminal domain-containing protein [unclassified Clostridium]|uniref:YveK family protein n=1 Tax=unclassified Clostridium TaxID=2614128 RepID=UPI0013F760F3|nr:MULTISPECIES: Wzz/FepE/Etk N-terminal domain-containing protein [unclassified Clostridium]NFN94100.1 capsular biosynthesis protein [Clostridium botulinum]NFS95158.1 capsular biosynthesis protein [Clostridium botulinum]
MDEKIVNNQDEISIGEILRVLMKKWKLIVVCTICTTLLAGIASFFINSNKNKDFGTKYVLYSKIRIEKQPSENLYYNNSDIQAYENLLSTYAQVISADDFAIRVIENNDLNITCEEIYKTLNVKQIENSQILEIKFANEDKSLAKNVLVGISNEFIDYCKEDIPNSKVEIIETAREANAEEIINNKISKKYIVIGLVLGLVGSIGLVFFLESINNTFKRKEQVEQMLGIPVIGIIPNELVRLKEIQ